MSAEHQPDAVALAIANDLLDRVGGNAATRFTSLGNARFKVLEEDAVDLARAFGAELPPEPGEGHSDICSVLVIAGYDTEGPGAPWSPGEALLAVWHVEDLEGAA
ncbi:hypothetical protein ACSFBI_01465 [Variovorax sp. RB3P1]|uniref:hypothetical protein n=1 Tax=Variovorax sp. RB3P1 TaxID=3443732 RepID=UPI003F46E6D7